ncbi:MAG: radical SAM family heme chaperone HemW [Eubacteriales bacterium]|nr:radical SAM family heme chaperone HemW [Eubacteriales bacterium]
MTITSDIGLYIHVPFCIRKCRYCRFLSFTCSENKLLAEYADALIREIRIRYGEWPYRKIDSIYIGGGTPSIMPAEDMGRVVKEIKDNFFVSHDCEITIEANPATITEDKLKTYLDCGINRISIGVQSFDNAILNFLGRVHDKNDAISAVRLAKKTGFDNVNIDLMFGIPGQTMKMWRDSIRQCLFLRPEHISLYSLQIEEGTPFYDMIYVDKVLSEVSENVDRDMFSQALMMMDDAGYHHYEISNASLPGFESRHNLKYWSYNDYLGLGPGASSFIGGQRFKNCESVSEYLKFIKSGMPPVKPEKVETYSEREEMGIFVFTGLRKTEGFSINDFENTFKKDFFDVYDPSILEKYKGFIEIDGLNLKLTEKGLDVSNKIMAEFV